MLIDLIQNKVYCQLKQQTGLRLLKNEIGIKLPEVEKKC